MSPKRVLLIEDEHRVQEAVRITLETMTNWQVVVAGSGREGLASARAEPPDLILLDLMMPEMNGVDTFRQLQADPVTRVLPVILLTAMGVHVEQERYLQMGIRAVLSKPFDPISLADQIRAILGWPT